MRSSDDVHHVAAPAAETGLPFSTSSIWNRSLPQDVKLDPRSSVLVASFNQQWQTFYGTVGINIDAYSISIYVAAADAPRVRVSISDGCNRDAGLAAQLQAVPIPADARPASGGDQSLVIWQPSSDTEWELWQARKGADGSWSACWGGRIENATRSDGVFPHPYGLAASGLSYLGGTIKAWELEAGEVRHAIAVAVPHTAAGTQVPPANRNDGNSTAADAIPEGTLFRLDPAIDVTTLHLTPVGLTVARALQRYGMFVTDTSGAVVLMAENAQTYVGAGAPNPYAKLFGSIPPYAVLDGIPWSRLQVVSPSAIVASSR